jgi:filamentous hemagglutinin
MNARLHRVVFNKARGLLMAVAETARACAPGARRMARSPRRAHRIRPSAIALAAWACLSTGNSLAQVIADPAAPAAQRPTVLLNADGSPLVNIQTPSVGGVSHNTYRQFDVQSDGVTLNNSRHSNPWLAGGEASVILNEVNSNNPSHLRGAITVNGSRAQVIVANPSGLMIDGARFVNASRATLTTGSAEFDNGEFKGMKVQQPVGVQRLRRHRSQILRTARVRSAGHQRRSIAMA